MKPLPHNPSTAPPTEKDTRVKILIVEDEPIIALNLTGEMDRIEAATIIQIQQDIPIIYLTNYTDEITLARTKTTAPLGLPA